MPKIKSYYLLTITESGGVSDELKAELILYFRNHDFYLLVEEGGDGHKEHYHLHGILSSSLRTDNIRRTLRPIYKRLGKELTAWGTKISVIKELSGALSYTYKEKRVLCSSGILLNEIREWVGQPRVSDLKGFKQVGKHNYVKLVTAYCDAKGIRPQTWLDIRNVMSDMIRTQYMFGQGNWCKQVVGKVLQYYGEGRYVLSCWDQSCDIAM